MYVADQQKKQAEQAAVATTTVDTAPVQTAAQQTA
jgi:hypothetical protein